MQTFNLDLSKKGVIPLMYAKQRDVGSKICVVLKDNGNEYVPEDGVTWSVWYSGASGEGNYDKIDDRDAVVVNGSTATVELIYQMLNNSGGGEMCLVMNSADGTQLGLWNIPYFVEAIPGADSEAATAYYQAFLGAQGAAEAAAKRAEAAAAKAEAGVDASIIVGLDEGDVATHTASEIYEAIQNKQTVVYRHDDRLGSEFISLKTASPSVAVFSKTGYPTEFDIFDIEIDDQGTVSYKTSFSSELVKQAVSYNPQEPTAEQQAQARENIKAATIDDTKAGADAWSSKNTVDRLCPAFTASGAAVVCEPVEGYPLGVVSKIELVQSGTGDPSPDNIRPISGYDKVKLTRCGKNLIPDKRYSSYGAYNGITFSDGGNGRVIVSGTATASSSFSYVQFGSGKRMLIPAGTYTISGNPDKDVTLNIPIYEDNETSDMKDFFIVSDGNSKTFTIEKDAYCGVYINIASGKSVTDVIISAQLEPGDTATAYEPYRGETFEIDLGQTVYGGTLDWPTGVLTVDKKVLTVDGTELAFVKTGSGTYWVLPNFSCPGAKEGYANKNSHLPPPCIGVNPNMKFVYVLKSAQDDFANVDELNAYLVEQNAAGTPLQVLYDLEEPITIQLTPQEILALSGINTLYSDTGDTEVTGRANPAAIINNLLDRLAAIEAAVVNNA